MKIQINMKRIQLISTLMVECRAKYPMPFKVMKRQQAEMYLNGLYAKLVRQFLITHKAKFYKKRVSKTTLKAFREWTFEGELQ